jgi:hypothetical protein
MIDSVRWMHGCTVSGRFHVTSTLDGRVRRLLPKVADAAFLDSTGPAQLIASFRHGGALILAIPQVMACGIAAMSGKNGHQPERMRTISTECRKGRDSDTGTRQSAPLNSNLSNLSEQTIQIHLLTMTNEEISPTLSLGYAPPATELGPTSGRTSFTVLHI